LPLVHADARASHRGMKYSQAFSVVQRLSATESTCRRIGDDATVYGANERSPSTRFARSGQARAWGVQGAKPLGDSMRRRRGREQKRAVAPAPRRVRWNWRLILLLAAVFAVKAIVLAQLQHHPLLEPDGGVDSAAYVALARRVLGGDLLLGPG